ncbi:MAG: hypothetical protein IID48_13525 [Proteobacteria bacterium]|nr:hypothetical protein [Pseudomonadota bacterium]
MTTPLPPPPMTGTPPPMITVCCAAADVAKATSSTPAQIEPSRAARRPPRFTSRARGVAGLKLRPR